MAKSAYIGVGDISRKITAGYIGVDGVARKIKKIYIGDANGIARLCWIDIVPLPSDLIAMLIDFNYTDNGDGTVTLTEWKGTLNGASSTELVIPNDNRIIL